MMNRLRVFMIYGVSDLRFGLESETNIQICKHINLNIRTCVIYTYLLMPSSSSHATYSLFSVPFFLFCFSSPASSEPPYYLHFHLNCFFFFSVIFSLSFKKIDRILITFVFLHYDLLCRTSDFPCYIFYQLFPSFCILKPVNLALFGGRGSEIHQRFEVWGWRMVQEPSMRT